MLIIALVSAIAFAVIIYAIYLERESDKLLENAGKKLFLLQFKEWNKKPFIASEYYDCIEKESLEILEEQKQTDQIIILWWGLDGLRLDEDGSLEWISRKKQKPVNQDVFYQPVQAKSPLYGVSDMCQSTQAQINALQTQNTVFQMQSTQQAQNMAMMAAFTSLYPSHFSFQQGLIAGAFPLTGCCCDQTILR